MNWKWARHFQNMLHKILQINYFLFHFNRRNVSVVYEMLCIPHFNWKRRKLIGQNKVKICKLWSQNFKFLDQKIVCPSDDIHNFYLAQSSWRTCLSGHYIYQPWTLKYSFFYLFTLANRRNTMNVWWGSKW